MRLRRRGSPRVLPLSSSERRAYSEPDSHVEGSAYDWHHVYIIGAWEGAVLCVCEGANPIETELLGCAPCAGARAVSCCRFIGCGGICWSRLGSRCLGDCALPLEGWGGPRCCAYAVCLSPVATR